ncbi:MAG: hypothetical protein SV201_15005, partial [Pseudomonadota bacterium]|nr:hypothetical protein [Pseudomonadota bacterium]
HRSMVPSHAIGSKMRSRTSKVRGDRVWEKVKRTFKLGAACGEAGSSEAFAAIRANGSNCEGRGENDMV